MISENLQRIITAKADIKNAVEEKGVTIPSSATIDEYADYIEQIEQGGGGGITPEIVRSNVWKTVAWENVTADNIWSDGENLYYSYSSTQQKWNPETKTWETFTGWKGMQSFMGSYIWKDVDGTIYYSNGGINMVLDKTTNTWSTKTWNGMTSFSGNCIWSDGVDLFFANGTQHKKLNRETDTWEALTLSWTSCINGMYGNNVWTDGEDYYYQMSYVINPDSYVMTSKALLGEMSYVNVYLDIWSDGDDTYYSYSTNQYKWDKSNKKFVAFTGWNGYSLIQGEHIWKDNSGVYHYDNYNTHYVLDKATKTWSEYTWGGMTQVSGIFIINLNGVYHHIVNGNVHYLDESTNSWISKTWQMPSVMQNTMDYFSSLYIWSDGVDTYFSYDNIRQLRYDSVTDSWVNMTWHGLDGYNFNARDGICHINGETFWKGSGTNQFKLDVATHTWNVVHFYTSTSAKSMYGYNLWRYNGETLYSNSSNEWAFDSATNTMLNYKRPVTSASVHLSDPPTTDGNNVYIGTAGILDKPSGKLVGYNWRDENGNVFEPSSKFVMTHNPAKTARLSAQAKFLGQTTDITDDDDITYIFGSPTRQLCMTRYYNEPILE